MLCAYSNPTRSKSFCELSCPRPCPATIFGRASDSNPYESTARNASTHYSITKNSESFNVEVVAHPSAVAVDYIREMPNGKGGGAYIQVTPCPISGSVITMTVPIGPRTDESEVSEVLERELLDLIQLAER